MRGRCKGSQTHQSDWGGRGLGLVSVLVVVGVLGLSAAVAAHARDHAPVVDAADAPDEAPTATTVAEDAPPTEPAVTEDSPVEIHASAEPATVSIGTPFRYTVEVAAAPGVEVVVTQPTERIGAFDIVDFGVPPPVERAGKTVVTRWYQLVGYHVGDHLLRSPPVHYRRPGEELTPAPADELLVSVESVLAKAGDAADIRDIKGPEAPPVNWRPYYFAAGVLAIVVLLALALHWTLNRPRRARAAPPRPAHELARDALQRLRYRKLVEQGAFKEYYSILSGIVRTYLEQRFDLRAPEMTTEEFLARSARDGRLQSGHRGLLAEFLSESDLVKFARHVPTIADSERAYAAAERFIDETAAAAAPAADVRVPPARPVAAAEERRAAG